MEDWLNQLFTGHGAVILYFSTVLILMLAGLGLPIPEEAIFLAAGFAASPDHLDGNVWVLMGVGLLGIMLGDSLPFWLGHRYGMSLLSKWPFCKVLSEKNVGHTKEFFAKHGSRTVFVARFVAGLRMPTFFLAGAMGLKYRIFFLYDFLGALLSCPISIWLAYRFGPVVKKWIGQSHVVLYVLIGVVVVYTIYHIASHREKKVDDPVHPMAVPPGMSKGEAAAQVSAKAEAVSAKLPE